MRRLLLLQATFPCGKVGLEKSPQTGRSTLFAELLRRSRSLEAVSPDVSRYDADVPVVTLYTRARCHLCEVVAETIDDVGDEVPFELVVRDIDRDGDPAIAARYHERVPVIAIDGVDTFEIRVGHDALRAAIVRAATKT